MNALTPRNIYIGVMCLAGAVLGLVGLNQPDLLSGYVSGFAVLLATSFLVDIVLMRFVGANGDVVPVSMEARFGGFFAGMLIYLGLTALFGAPPA